MSNDGLASMPSSPEFYGQEITQEEVLLAGPFLRFLNGALLHTAGNRRLQRRRALRSLMAA